MGSGTRNRFEALCELASQEQWCWNLVCTTCGHCVFRWALKALARGHHPDSAAWPVHWGRDTSTRTLELSNGPLPSWGAWPLAEQQAIQSCVPGCRLSHIAETVSFPDWLGYIGIVLSYTETAEVANHVISDVVGPQLASAVRSDGPAAAMLSDVRAGRPLRWPDLELVEQDYRVKSATTF
jgi:hypothetical protein